MDTVRPMIVGVLDRVMRRLPDLRPAVDVSEIEWKQGLMTRGPVALPVTW
ncbi:MAG TPA: hypothetical protein VFM54_04880 [Micromonosporaceae bacterium]|nr:hypothetical protein [Micromonosporaceae bacterium]